MQVDLQDHGLVADVAKLAALQPVQRLGATRRPPTPHSSGGQLVCAVPGCGRSDRSAKHRHDAPCTPAASGGADAGFAGCSRARAAV